MSKIKDKINNIFNILMNKSNDGQKKIYKKLKILKKKYDLLNLKLMDGSMTNSELIKYNGIKCELEKMAKKFKLKDGKFVLNDDSQGDDEMVNEKKENESSNSNKSSNESADVENEKGNEEDNVEYLKRQLREQEEYMRQQQQQLLKQRQNQQQQRQPTKEEIMNDPRYEQYRQHLLEQQRQQQKPQSNEQQTELNKLKIYLYVEGLPELSLFIRKEDVETFAISIAEAVKNGTIFVFGNYVVNGAKILMYKIVQVDN